MISIGVAKAVLFLIMSLRFEFARASSHFIRFALSKNRFL